MATGVGGALYVELLDADAVQRPLAGFALGDVTGVRGNFVSKTIRWSGGTSLSKLAGSTVALRVYMTDAKLYSATFTCATA